MYQKCSFLWQCRERDSNPHSCNSQGILSPSCLPFHHRGSRPFAICECKVTKKERDIKENLTFFHLHTKYVYLTGPVLVTSKVVPKVVVITCG